MVIVASRSLTGAAGAGERATTKYTNHTKGRKAKFKFRNPKAEFRMKSEIRNPNETRPSFASIVPLRFLGMFDGAEILMGPQRHENRRALKPRPNDDKIIDDTIMGRNKSI